MLRRKANGNSFVVNATATGQAGEECSKHICAKAEPVAPSPWQS